MIFIRISTLNTVYKFSILKISPRLSINQGRSFCLINIVTINRPSEDVRNFFSKREALLFFSYKYLTLRFDSKSSKHILMSYTFWRKQLFRPF